MIKRSSSGNYEINEKKYEDSNVINKMGYKGDFDISEDKQNDANNPLKRTKPEIFFINEAPQSIANLNGLGFFQKLFVCAGVNNKNADIRMIALFSIKRLTFGDLKKCLEIYMRNVNHLSKVSRFYKKDFLPDSMLDLKKIIEKNYNRENNEKLDDVTILYLRKCLSNRVAHCSYFSKNFDSWSSKIYKSLSINPQLAEEDVHKFHLQPENRIRFLKTLKKLTPSSCSKSVLRNLEGLEAITNNEWIIKPHSFNTFKTSYGKIFLDTYSYVTANDVKRLIDHIFDIYHTGYQIAQRLDKFNTYFDTFSGWDCLAGSTRNLSKWLVKWSEMLGVNQLSMNSLMERAGEVLPSELQKITANPIDILNWYDQNFSGMTLANGKMIDRNDFKIYLCSYLGFNESEFKEEKHENVVSVHRLMR